MEETMMTIYEIFDGILKVIEGLIVLAIVALMIAWFMQFQNMGTIDQLIYKADVLANGEAVALFRNFKDYVVEVANMIVN